MDPASSPKSSTVEIRLSEVVSALSYALDITEGQPEGHALRSCLIGMNLAETMELDSGQRSALFYGLLLKDLGCSTNASKTSYLFGSDDHYIKQGLKTTNWSNLISTGLYVLRSAGDGRSLWSRLQHTLRTALAGQGGARELFQLRCERGADIARMLGFPEATAQAILDLDEHWDGKGNPLGKRGEEISLLGRILCFAQTVEVFYGEGGPDAARRIIRRRRGSWFDPELCELFLAKVDGEEFWGQMSSGNLIQEISAYEPDDQILKADDELLDTVAAAFARVIDAKSPYTATHSQRVAQIARGMADEIKLAASEKRDLHRAALLHDIGKLGVSNLILDKPGKLDEDEWAKMQEHTAFTYRILDKVNGFSRLADMASAHHERLDGKGYHRQVQLGELDLSARLLAVADQFEALTAERPYRAALSTQTALEILERDVGTGIDPKAFEALRAYVERKATQSPGEPG